MSTFGAFLDSVVDRYSEAVILLGLLLYFYFQTSKTGSPSEYNQIEETFAPTVMETMAAWILKQK